MHMSIPRHRLAGLSRSPSLISRLLRLAELRRQRRQLASLDATRLDDIGISPDAARQEAARPVWDAPATWCH